MDRPSARIDWSSICLSQSYLKWRLTQRVHITWVLDPPTSAAELGHYMMTIPTSWTVPLKVEPDMIANWLVMKWQYVFFFDTRNSINEESSTLMQEKATGIWSTSRCPSQQIKGLFGSLVSLAVRTQETHRCSSHGQYDMVKDALRQKAH